MGFLSIASKIVGGMLAEAAVQGFAHPISPLVQPAMQIMGQILDRKRLLVRSS